MHYRIVYPYLCENIAYYQLSDNDKEMITPCIFKAKVQKDERGIFDTVAHITKCISDSIGNAQPQYTEAEERAQLEDLKKKMVLESENRSIG